MAQVWVGTSGYVYRHWREGVFYPPELRARDELAWYATRFRTVELNSPFYRVPSAETVDRWREATPDDFVFAVKVSREISHLRRLRDVAAPLGTFVALVRRLGPKLGPLLVQLPATLPIDRPRLADFLELLEQDLRWTLEVRHPSWQTPAVYDALAHYGVALCVPVGGRVQPDLVTTAGFSYLRLHAGEAPGGGFSDEQIGRWSARVRALARSGKDVYAFFNNDREGHAVRDAARLLARLRLGR